MAAYVIREHERGRALGGDPRGPVRAQPVHAGGSETTAGPAGIDPRARRRRRVAAFAPSRSRRRFPTFFLFACSIARGADRDVPGREPVRLEEDDVVRRAAARELSGDDLMELVHLEPVEDAALDGLDQVSRLDLRLLDRVAADEDGALEDDVVELARLRPVRADGADERPRLEPFAAENGILRGRDRDDDVLLGRVAVALAGLGADLLAERAQALLRPAVGDDSLDPGQRLPDARDLALGLPAAADDAERARAVCGRGTSRRPRSRRRCAAGPCRSASITAASSALARSKSTTTNGVPAG